MHISSSTTEPQASTGIFCSHGPRHLQLASKGALASMRLAVKDLFQLQGERNAAGNPDWFSTHGPATETALALQQLLTAGAEFVGFTLTDELAYSLQGDNSHYGSADNPRLPGHYSGGSSSGSAAAVAAGLADIGLGTDTGGSIRVPASYCGLYGIRPSHGAVSVAGLIALAPSFDTVGWFCRDAQLLEKVGEQLLPAQTTAPATQLIICPELMALAAPEWQAAMANYLTQLRPLFAQVTEAHLPQQFVDQLAECFRVLQGREVYLQHKDWIANSQPRLTPAVAERMKLAAEISDAQVAAAVETQKTWQSALAKLLPDDQSVLLLPSTPTTAPKRGGDTASNNQLRQQTLKLTAVAGLSGSVQVHLPAFNLQEDDLQKPSGFSLLMRPQNDLTLLALVRQLAAKGIAPNV